MAPLFDDAALRKLVMERLMTPPAAQTVSAAAADPSPGIGAAPYLALAGGVGADIGSTLGALSRGGREQVLPGNPAAMALTRGGLGIAEALIMKLLAKRGHPTLAKILGYGAGAAGGAAAVHNMNVSR